MSDDDLKSLFDNPNNVPNINGQSLFKEDVPNNPTFDDTYPAYSQFLKNARKQVVNNILPKYLNSDDPIVGGRRNLNYGQSQSSGLGSDIDAALEHAKMLNIYKNDPSSNSMPLINNGRRYILDKNNNVQQNPYFLGKNEINEQIVKDYISSKHPEQIQNRSIENKTPEEIKELSTGVPGGIGYQQQIAEELTGVPSNKLNYRINPDIINNGELGNTKHNLINKQNNVEVQSPDLLETPVHEYLHILDFLRGNHSYPEHPDLDLLNSKNLAQDMYHTSGAHINQQLKEQTNPELFNKNPGYISSLHKKAPLGEPAFLYNKLRDYLNSKEQK